MSKRFLVTGGAGFIGSAVVRHLIRDTEHRVLVIDKLTYAGNLKSLAPVANDPRYAFVRADIVDGTEGRQGFRGVSARRGHASCGRKPCRSLDRRARGVHRNEHYRHLHAAGSRSCVLARLSGSGACRVSLPSCLDRRGVRHPR